jgi:hypothetical protein
MSGYLQIKPKKKVTFEMDPVDWAKTKMICNLKNISFTKFITHYINEGIETEIEYFKKNVPDAYNLIKKFDEDNSILETQDKKFFEKKNRTSKI